MVIDSKVMMEDTDHGPKITESIQTKLSLLHLKQTDYTAGGSNGDDIDSQ